MSKSLVDKTYYCHCSCRPITPAELRPLEGQLLLDPQHFLTLPPNSSRCDLFCVFNTSCHLPNKHEFHANIRLQNFTSTKRPEDPVLIQHMPVMISEIIGIVEASNDVLKERTENIVRTYIHAFWSIFYRILGKKKSPIVSFQTLWNEFFKCLHPVEAHDRLIRAEQGFVCYQESFQKKFGIYPFSLQTESKIEDPKREKKVPFLHVKCTNQLSLVLMNHYVELVIIHYLQLVVSKSIFCPRYEIQFFHI